MTEPMEILYTYAQEHIVHALLLPSALEHLDNLLDEQHLVDFYREQSMFRAGFSLAVELMRA